jgi:beta-ribofuranosylaminobenzene 5'-phosphate synthase
LHDGVPLPASVTVTVPARLHLGFLDLNGGLGRRFGSIGLAISDLRTRITIRRATHSRVSGPESDRVRQYLQTMERVLALDESHAADIAEVVPAHAGLGSGTQLALAVAAGLRRLHHRPLDIEGDAFNLGRGTRSGIGIGLFSRGGLVVDGGRGRSARPAPIISHLPFPDRWRVLVVLDPKYRGLHGLDEVTTFAALAPDLVSFSAAIKELQVRLGDYFAPAQGGSRFTSSDVASVLDALDDAGAFGIGQSSWGPTGFVFAPSPEEAHRLAAIAGDRATGRGLDIRLCRGLNRGAEIIAHAPEHERGQ